MPYSRIITVAKHNERRNGEKTPCYWRLETVTHRLTHDLTFSEKYIDAVWFERNLPKKFKLLLNKSPKDPNHYCLKLGKFKITLKRAPVFDDFGNISPNDVIDLVYIKPKTKQHNK